MVRRSIGIVFIFACMAACAGDDPAGPDPVEEGPDRITSFDFLAGTWNVTSRFLDDGVFVESQAVAIVEASIGGRVHKERRVGTRDGRTVEVLAFYGRSDRAGQWLIARGDGDRGTFDILEGPLGATRVSLDSRSGTRPDGGRERVTFDSLTTDRFLRTVERSTDQGASWTVYGTMEYRRAPAGTALPAPPSQSPGCTDPAYRQFDFWVGDWDIGSARNTIPARLGGCIVEENWVGPETGTSFNMYDPRSGLWTQVWIDDNDNTLFIQGGLDGDDMVMQGPGANPSNRITWSPLPGGRVRQHGQTSTDGGSNWSTSYDLTYVPRTGGG